MRPLLASTPGPLEGHVAAGVGGNHHLGERCVEAAEEILVGRTLDWADVRDETDRAGTCFLVRLDCDFGRSSLSRLTFVLVRHVALVGLSVDDHLADEAVRGDVRESGGECGKDSEVLHGV